MLTIELLERSYNKQSPLLACERDYRASLEEIGRQGVAGPIYQILKENQSLTSVPAFFKEGLERQRERHSYLNLLIKNEAERIVAALDSEGIPAIVLKGLWLSRRLYGSSGVRQTGDVDLLIHKEQLEAASKILLSLGYIDVDIERHSSYHHLFGKWNPSTKMPIHVELHWHVVQTDYCRMECGPLWEQSQPLPSRDRIRELSIPDLFYTLCLHSAKHNMASLKHVLDIVRTIHLYGAQISYEKLLRRAREDHLYGMVVMALSVVYRLMPHLMRVKPFGETKTWFPWNQELAWRKEEDYRLFRFKGLAYYLHQVLFTLGKLDLPRYRILYLWRMVFPPPELIRIYLGRPATDSSFGLYMRWIGRFRQAGRRKAAPARAADIIIQGEDHR